MQMPGSLRSAGGLKNARGLTAFALLVIGVMVAVILWGAVVRATGSGNGCGDNWPLCNHQWVPAHPRLATVIEFVHRQTSALCTLLVLTLLAWTFAARPRGSLARRAAVWTSLLLVTEAILGAILVLGHFTGRDTRNLRVLVQGVHLSNTMLLLAAMTLAWWWQQPHAPTALWTPPLRRLARWSLLATLLTAATGSVAALADTLFPSPSFLSALRSDLSASAPLLLHMRLVHPVAAILAAALTLALATRLYPGPRRLLLALFAAQLALGLLDVVLLAPLSLQVLHLLLADILWIAQISVASDALHRRSSASHTHPVIESQPARVTL